MEKEMTIVPGIDNEQEHEHEDIEQMQREWLVALARVRILHSFNGNLHSILQTKKREIKLDENIRIIQNRAKGFLHRKKQNDSANVLINNWKHRITLRRYNADKILDFLKEGK